MNETIRDLLEQISALEDKLRDAMQEQQGKLRYKIEGKRVAFEQSVREAHARVKTRIIPWILTNRPQNLLTAPIIYSMIVPLLIADLCVTFYQWTCFPVYRIARVRRNGYFVYDHQHLAYLNLFEKFHCLYCSYANGVLAYAREIVGRTEQYFCPIKHARKVLATHRHYRDFMGYGEADEYHQRLEEFRAALAHEKQETKRQGTTPTRR